MSKAKKVKLSNRIVRKITRAKRPVDLLLRGYKFEHIDGQLQQYKLKQYGSKYEILPDEGTAAEIQEIQNNLQEEDSKNNFKYNNFKFAPILHEEEDQGYSIKHWCCGVITHDKIYIF